MKSVSVIYITIAVARTVSPRAMLGTVQRGAVLDGAAADGAAAAEAPLDPPDPLGALEALPPEVGSGLAVVAISSAESLPLARGVGGGLAAVPTQGVAPLTAAGVCMPSTDASMPGT